LSRVSIWLTPQGIWDPDHEIDHSWDDTCQEHDIDDNIEQNGKIDKSTDARDSEGGGQLYFHG
jgi:hypothetical protein